MLDAIVFIALIVLFIVPATFVWHDVYQDGVFGRIGLCGISLFAFIRLALTLQGSDRSIPVEVELLIVAAAVFLVWHLFRFHSRALREKRERAPFRQGAR